MSENKKSYYLDNESIFKKILNANLRELIQLKIETTSWTEIQSIYLFVMISYLKNDILSLESLVRILETRRNENTSRENLEEEVIYRLSRARLFIRKYENLYLLLEELDLIKLESDLWRAEVNFVKALAYGCLHQYELENKSYYLAYQFFSQIGLTGKGLLSLHNSLAAEASLFPEKRLTVEYHHLMKLALRNKIYSIAGLCALNLSREYQNLKAHLISHKFASLAVNLLKSDVGTQHYGLALCHRAQLLFEMDRSNEAIIDLEETMAIDFIEVINARLILQNKYYKNFESTNGNHAPAWINRDYPLNKTVANSFGITEQKLIRLLSQRPLDKNELIDQLFANELKTLDYDTILNRFKNLLSRVRKKDSQLLLFDGVKYSLSPKGAIG